MMIFKNPQPKRFQLIAFVLASLLSSTSLIAFEIPSYDFDSVELNTERNDDIPDHDEIYEDYEMFEYQEWQKGPSAKLLFGELDPDLPTEYKENKECTSEEEAIEARKSHYYTEDGRKLPACYTPYKVKIFEYQANFVVNKPVQNFSASYLNNASLIRDVNTLFVNLRPMGMLEVAETVGDTHFMVADGMLYPENTYFYSELYIPDNKFIKNTIANYFAEKEAKKNGEGDEVVYDPSTFKIRVLSELKAFDQLENTEIDDLVRYSGAPITNKPVHSLLLQRFFYADHIIRFANIAVYFQELSPGKTNVTMKIAVAVNERLLKKRYGMSPSLIFVHGIAGIEGALGHARNSAGKLKYILEK